MQWTSVCALPRHVLIFLRKKEQVKVTDVTLSLPELCRVLHERKGSRGKWDKLELVQHVFNFKRNNFIQFVATDMEST